MTARTVTDSDRFSTAAAARTLICGWWGRGTTPLSARGRAEYWKKSSSTTRVDSTELSHYTNPANPGTLANAYTW